MITKLIEDGKHFMQQQRTPSKVAFRKKYSENPEEAKQRSISVQRKSVIVRNIIDAFKSKDQNDLNNTNLIAIDKEAKNFNVTHTVKGKRPSNTLFVIPSISNDEWKRIKNKEKVESNIGADINSYYLKPNETSQIMESEESLLHQADLWGEKKSGCEGEYDMRSLSKDLSLASLQSKSHISSTHQFVQRVALKESLSPINKMQGFAFP